jgi:DNA-binding GntR family transcriptional regulator
VSSNSPAATHDPSAVERVADWIREDIRQGRFSAGQRLTEAELTLRMSASRGPVREALRRLEADGILKFEKHKGVSVRRLTRDDFVNLLEVRESLEGLGARLVASLPTAGPAIRELAKLFEQMKRAADQGDLERYNLGLYIPFHALLVESSGNPVLVRQWHQLNLDVLRQQFRPLIGLDLVRVSQGDHATLVAALVARDAARAERTVRRHIRNFTEHVRGLPAEMFADFAVSAAPPSPAAGRPASAGTVRRR